MVYPASARCYCTEELKDKRPGRSLCSSHDRPLHQTPTPRASSGTLFYPETQSLCFWELCTCTGMGTSQELSAVHQMFSLNSPPWVLAASVPGNQGLIISSLETQINTCVSAFTVVLPTIVNESKQPINERVTCRTMLHAYTTHERRKLRPCQDMSEPGKQEARN